MKTLLIGALGLASIPLTAVGEQFVIFLDNSASVKGGEVYLADINDIMSVAGRNRYLFAPIGAAEDDLSGDIPVAVRSTDDDPDGLVRSVFRFEDNYTRIDASLEQIEALPEFADTDEVVIVSDMDPDAQLFRGSGWCFNLDDIDDLIATHARLERWLDGGTRITIALHHWSTKSTAFFSDDDLQRIDQDLAQRRRAIAQRTVCNTGTSVRNNPKTAGRERWENKRLVEKMVGSLELRYPEQVRLYNIPRNKPDEFLGLLCGRLDVDDIDQQVCQQPEKKEFRILVGFDRKLSVGQSQAGWVRRKLPDEIYVPEKRLIPKEDLQVLNKNPVEDETKRNDYTFVVIAGTEGQPFYQPKIYSFVKRPNGKVEAKDVVTTEHINPDQLAMLDWVVTRITDLLEDYIDEDFPVSKPLKRIKVAQFDNDGKPIPIPSGYVFFIETTYPDVQGPIRTKTRTPDAEGLLGFRIPRSEEAENALFLRTSADDRLLVANIPGERIKDRKPIKIGIRPEYFRPIDIEIASSMPAVDTEGSADAATIKPFQVELAAFLIEPDEYEVLRETVGVPGVAKIELLPGTYSLELVPIGRPELRAFIQDKLVVPSDRRVEEVLAELGRDPLYRKPGDAVPESWLGLSDWVQLGRLNNEALDATGGSAFILTALLRYTSSAMEQGQDQDELTKLWKLLREELFIEQGRTKERQLDRALQQLGFNEDDGASRYLLVKAMFDQFIGGRSSILAGTTDDKVNLRRNYNTWLNRITDRPSGNRLMSGTLADVLEFKGEG